MKFGAFAKTFDFYDFKPFHTFLNDFEIFTLQLFFPRYLVLVTSLLCLVPPSSNSMILIVIAFCIKVYMKFERVFKMRKNGVYFIVIPLLLAKLHKNFMQIRGQS